MATDDVRADAPMTFQAPVHDFIVLSDNGREVLRVKHPDGAVVFGEGATHDEASRLFWRHLGGFIAAQRAATGAEPADEAERFIEYVFGKFDYRRVLREQMVPPWPLERHLVDMGLGHRSTPTAGVSGTGHQTFSGQPPMVDQQ
jgi:hypothetical protein